MPSRTFEAKRASAIESQRENWEAYLVPWWYLRDIVGPYSLRERESAVTLYFLAPNVLRASGHSASQCSSQRITSGAVLKLPGDDDCRAICPRTVSLLRFFVFFCFFVERSLFFIFCTITELYRANGVTEEPQSSQTHTKKNSSSKAPVPPLS